MPRAPPAASCRRGRGRPTPLVLGTSVGLTWTAHRRLQRLDPTGAQRVIPVSTGLLLGWTGVAALVNAASVVTPRHVEPTARPVVLAESGALLAGAATIA